ncbi:high mobility group box domain-containing protein [Thamnidium elegans]|nr:high mobility group box domain-containing protein [Thamnidium elegans]
MIRPANNYHHHHNHLQRVLREEIDEEEDDDNYEELMNASKKAPNSFLLYKTKRRNDSNGQELSSRQLIHEWRNMSNEQKTEFQNQSQCLQFTLDIDSRISSSINTKNVQLLPKIIVPPPSSMVIPNDHSSPTTTDLLYNHHQHPQQHHYQPHYYQHSHHQLSDLLLIGSPPIHHSSYYYSEHHILNEPSSPTSSSSSSLQQPQHTNNGYISYSAAAEAAALQSLSFNEEESITIPDKNDQNLKKKYGTLPEKVKRPPNAYLLFNRDMRRQLKDVNQGLSSGEISKSISSRWKKLSSSEREYYIQEEIKLKQLHNKQHTNFIYTRRSKAEMREADSLKRAQQKTNVLSVVQPSQKQQQQQQQQKKKILTTTRLVNNMGRDPRGRKKKKLDSSLPKHPMSGYLHFAKKMRPVMKEKYPDARLVEISKQIGSQWRSMSEEELRPWQEIANRDKERYAREMKDRLIQQKTEEDSTFIPSPSSTCSNSSLNYIDYNNKKRKISVSSNTTINSATNNDTLDSHTIATVAQMVNPISNSF